jgi:hypothetical protein
MDDYKLSYEVERAIRNLGVAVDSSDLGDWSDGRMQVFYKALLDHLLRDDDDEDQLVEALQARGFTVDHPKWNTP